LGVDTRVDSLSISLLGGEIMIADLAVDNPEGFKAPHLMKLGRMELGVRAASLFSDTIEVRRFEIDGLEMNIEQTIGSNNLAPILANLRRLEGNDDEEEGEEEGDKEEEGNKGGGKKMMVNRIVIRNVVANVELLPGMGQVGTKTIKIPEIVLENLTSENASGILIGELSGRLVMAVITSIVDKHKELFSDKLLDNITGDIEAAAKGLESVIGSIGKESGETKEAPEKDVGKFLKGALDKLIGGKKPSEEGDGKDNE
ncbi:MAG: hypothetical protein QF662_04045, partial [Phycisphaerae bacterium]|nr:hypothetical protein [Phycisphaerae bacterium]